MTAMDRKLRNRESIYETARDERLRAIRDGAQLFLVVVRVDSLRYDADDVAEIALDFVQASRGECSVVRLNAFTLIIFTRPRGLSATDQPRARIGIAEILPGVPVGISLKAATAAIDAVEARL